MHSFQKGFTKKEICMVLLEFSMSPFDKGESLSASVALIIDYIDKSGVTYQLTGMGTILEGEWEDVMGVVDGCFRIMRQSSSRISLQLKMDYREGDTPRLKKKVEKIETILQRKLNTAD